MASTFEKETRVTPATDHPPTYDAVIDPSWRVWDGPNGGYLAAILHRAVRAALPEAGPLRDLSVSLLEPADPGPATVTVEPLREGGSVTVARARLDQGGPALVELRATMGADRDGPAFVAPDPPTVVDWSRGWPLPDDAGVEPPTFTQHCEYRIAGGDPPLAGEVGGDMRVWMRMAEPTPTSEPLVVFLADAWMAAVYTVLDEPLPAPSLEIDLQLHELPEDRDAGEPLLGVFEAVHASDGYAFEDGQLWTADGDLVARARQTRRILTG